MADICNYYQSTLNHQVNKVMKKFRVTKHEVYECLNYNEQGNDFEKYELIKKNIFEQFEIFA